MKNLFDLSKDLGSFFPHGMRLEAVYIEKNNLSADIVVSKEGIEGYWKLDAMGLNKISTNLFCHNFIPNYTVKLLKNHQLLWEFNSDMVYLEIHGFFDSNPKFQNSFKHQLFQSSNGWFDFYSIFRDSLWRKGSEFIEKKGSEVLEAFVSEELFTLISQLCQSYQFSVLSRSKVENTNPRKSKLLLFTNDFLAKNEYCANQPYLIAEEISIIPKIKN